MHFVVICLSACSNSFSGQLSRHNNTKVNKGRGRGYPSSHTQQSFAANTCKCQQGRGREGTGKSNIIDRCTERSLATVAAGANPIKIGSVSGLSTCLHSLTHSQQFTMGTHSCIRAFIWPTSRLSVNQRHRQSRRRYRDRGGEGRGRRSNPQPVANAARCSMIFKKFLFIYKTRAGARAGGQGQGGRASSTTGA